MYLGAKEKNAGTLPHIEQRKHVFLGKIKEMSKTKKLPARKKIALELLHQILVHRSTRSLIDGDTANFWEDIELKIDPHPFCISCQMSSMNKKDKSKIPLEPKAPFEWVFMDISPSTVPKKLTTDTSFSNYLLIVNAYYKLQKLYGMEKITTEEVMDKLDMFQSRFGKIDEFGWWDLERISADTSTQFTSTEFKQECQTRGVNFMVAVP